MKKTSRSQMNQVKTQRAISYKSILRSDRLIGMIAICVLFSNLPPTKSRIRSGSKQVSNGYYTTELTLHCEQAQIRHPL
jgi:hypothetical protein